MAAEGTATAGTDVPASPVRITSASTYVRSQLDGALSLSSYATSVGFQTTAGEPLALADIGVIQSTAVNLGLGGEDSSAIGVTTAEWIAFEQAYYRLAFAMSPVTAETLAATQAVMPGGGEASTLFNRIFGYSPALRFTRGFAVVAIVIAAFVVIAECQVAVYGLETDATKFFWQKNILQSLLPWAYGALGSCAYLLRSAHYYIYQRSFDLRRKPEYFNRVLLGAISGGAIILFVNYLVNEGDDTVLHLSSAALGFVAGYSTDFLFNTIERVVAAIFPKTDSDPKVSQRPQKPVANKPRPVQDNDGSRDDPGNVEQAVNGNQTSKPRRSSKKPAIPAAQTGAATVKDGH